MRIGWHYLENSDPLPALGSATFLDVAGQTKGMQSLLRLCRLYYKGRPSAQECAFKALAWAKLGCRVQLGNEANHPIEQWSGTPADYAAFYYAVKELAPESLLYWAAPSPGFPGWELWYDGAENADGLAVHAYGSYAEMCAVTEYVTSRFPSKPIWVSEANFGPGPGRVVDRDAWAHDHLTPFLDCCATQPQIEAVSYFAYRWPNPDLDSATPVDGAGTQIEMVLRIWKQEETMANWAYSLGFADYAQAHPEIGTPTSDLQYDANGNGWQFTSAGMLVWNKQGNQIHFFRRAIP